MTEASGEQPRWVDEDRWLTELIGKACYRLSLAGSTIAAAVARQRLDEVARTNAFVYAKVPTDNRDGATWLRERQFCLVETAITLQKPASADRSANTRHDQSVCIRPARPDDADKVAGLAARAFASDRFHSDPMIPNETANRIKACWARGFFHRQRGDAMVVAEVDGAIVGFNQLVLRPDGSLVIDLMAVAPEYRGRGIATGLIRSAEAAFEDIERVVVETQIANKPSIALYQAVGFRLSDSKYVFHRHTSV